MLAEISPDRDLLKKTSFWLICFAYWNVVVLMYVFQWYAYDSFGGRHTLIFQDLLWSMAVWYSRALLSPLVFWLAIRWPIPRDTKFKWLLSHFFTGILLGTLATLLQASAFHLLGKGRPIQDAMVKEMVLRHASFGTPGYWMLTALLLGWNYIVYNILTYWTVVALVQGWRNYDDARRKEMQTIQLQSQLASANLDVLRMQLHPHFLFNTLHAVTTLIHDEPDMAEDMLLRLSQLLRVLLEETNVHEVSLRKELLFLEWHLGIEKIRFGDRLQTKIDVDQDALDCAVPHLILQPLIENAINHGIAKYAGADLIEVRGKLEKQTLFLEVRNITSILETPQHTSKRGIGLSNTESRLKALYNEKFSFELQSICPRGVVVKIALPARMLALDPVSATEPLYDDQGAYR